MLLTKTSYKVNRKFSGQQNLYTINSPVCLCVIFIWVKRCIVGFSNGLTFRSHDTPELKFSKFYNTCYDIIQNVIFPVVKSWCLTVLYSTIWATFKADAPPFPVHLKLCYCGKHWKFWWWTISERMAQWVTGCHVALTFGTSLFISPREIRERTKRRYREGILFALL